MMRGALLLIILLALTGPAGVTAQVPTQPPSQPPEAAAEEPPSATEPRPWSRLVERLLFNPRERTARGLEATVESVPATADPEAPVDPLSAATAAIGPFDSAARLADDAQTAFNAGTARLLAERADAAPLLQSAIDNGDDALASRAAYNLGNANLEASDFQGAIDAYKTALRRQPSLRSAKHNLEIAIKRLREQQKQQQKNPNQEPNPDQQDQQDQQDNENQQDQQDQDQQDQQDQDQQDQDQQDQQDQQQQESPLPQFEDQPDMSAQEAAAILEAVENLEREARRQEALEAARKQAKGKKDW